MPETTTTKFYELNGLLLLDKDGFKNEALKIRLNKLNKISDEGISNEDLYRIIDVECQAMHNVVNAENDFNILNNFRNNFFNDGKTLPPLSTPFNNRMRGFALMLLSSPTVINNLATNKESKDADFITALAHKLILCDSVAKYKAIHKEIYHLDAKYKFIKDEFNKYDIVVQKKLEDILPQTTIKELNINEIRDNFTNPSRSITSAVRKGESGADVVMSEESLMKFSKYLEEIKNKIRKGIIPITNDFNNDNYPAELTQHIGKNLFFQLQEFALNEDHTKLLPQKILDMKPSEFISCLYKTTLPQISPEADPSKTEDWNKTECDLLADSPKVVRGVKALTTSTTKEAKVEHLIDPSKRPTIDMIFFHAPLVSLNNPLDFHKVFPKFDLSEIEKLKSDLIGRDPDSPDTITFKQEFMKKHFDEEGYKALLSQRILPALIQMSKEHPEGFVFTTPALGADSFAGSRAMFGDQMREVFESSLKDIIQNNINLLPNLKGVVYTGGQDNNDELIELNDKNKNNSSAVLFIKTNKLIGTAPLLNNDIVDALKTKFNGNDIKKFHVVTGIAGDAFSNIANEFNDNQKDTQEAAVCAVTNVQSIVIAKPGELQANSKGIYSYQPIDGFKPDDAKKKTWRNFQSDSGTTVNKITAVSVKQPNYSHLHNMTMELLNSPDINTDKVKARLCAMYIALTESKNKDDKELARDLRKQFPLNVIEKYRRDNKEIMLVQKCLAGVTGIETAQKEKHQDRLISHLNTLINGTNPISISELNKELKAYSADLKNKTERISIFGRHRLRDYIDNFSKNLEHSGYVKTHGYRK